jgi:cob(I)alamin adenosyltransferase
VAAALEFFMVKLNKIYTRTGDDGTTGLATGDRVRKDDLRVECYGTVDEANACIGLAVLSAGVDAVSQSIARVLRDIQNDLFDLGADLATPRAEGEKPGAALRMVPTQTERLEHVIDEFNERLKPLTSFVLPGGTPLAAHLHLARTVVRRAERLGVSLLAAESATVNPEAIRYLNRVSDLLFVLGRVANNDGKSDVLWVPGANRASGTGSEPA